MIPQHFGDAFREACEERPTPGPIEPLSRRRALEALLAQPPEEEQRLPWWLRWLRRHEDTA